MGKAKFCRVKIGLTNGERWTVIHNLSTHGIYDTEAALRNYLALDKTPNIQGFCSYIEGKGDGFYAFTGAELMELFLDL